MSLLSVEHWSRQISGGLWRHTRRTAPGWHWKPRPAHGVLASCLGGVRPGRPLPQAEAARALRRQPARRRGGGALAGLEGGAARDVVAEPREVLPAMRRLPGMIHTGQEHDGGAAREEGSVVTWWLRETRVHTQRARRRRNVGDDSGLGKAALGRLQPRSPEDLGVKLPPRSRTDIATNCRKSMARRAFSVMVTGRRGDVGSQAPGRRGALERPLQATAAARRRTTAEGGASNWFA